jgi:hypothetical protein
VNHGRQPRSRSLARWAILALALVLGLTYALTAQTTRILDEAFPPDAHPIQLNADHIASWKENGQQLFLLRGHAVINQGAMTIRSSDLVVSVDLRRFEKDRVLPAMIYGEGPIQFERGKVIEAPHGFVQLATTSKLDIKPFKSKLVERDLSADPVYQRALERRQAMLKPPAPKVDETVRQTAYQPLPPAPPPVPPEAKVPVIPLPGPAPEPNVALGPIVGTPAPAPARTTPILSVKPRYQGDLQVKAEPSKTEPGVTAVIVTGGASLLVQMPPSPGKKATFLDLEADRIVIWTRGNAKNLFNSKDGSDDSGAHEVYLAGHVELRTRTDQSIETLRADEMYYDFRRNVAVARQADLEIRLPKISEAVHLTTPELRQESLQVRTITEANVSAGKLPSDPGLYVSVKDARIEERRRERSYLWGLWPAYDKDGQPIVDTDQIFTGKNMFLTLEGVPIFYFPYLRGRVEDPLGPLDAVNFSFNRIFGAQFSTTWDIYELLDLPRVDGTRWRLYADWLTARGPALGTEFDLAGRDYFGIKGQYNGLLKLYGISDRKADVLGFDRGNIIYWPNQFSGNPISHPDFRGIAHGKINIQDMDYGFSVLGQMAFISDRNFLEQYYLDSHLNDLNYDTYLRVKQQQGIWAWTAYGQVRTREWETETNWLPKADFYAYGKTFSFDRFEDLFVYNVHASAGYAQLMPTNVVPFAYLPTDVRTDTARLDLWQDISMPFYLGPVKLAPYGVLDLTYYSSDVNGDDLGRIYGGGGVRGSIPFTRHFPSIQSDLFNLNGIDHKISLTGNYFIAQSSTNFNNLPQLSRWNDDSSDQALRDIRPVQTIFNPANAAFLTTSQLFNPQTYAIRRLIDTNPDTLDSINVFQMGLRQRWQTQRGFPGNEHTVDWMALNVQASAFPNANRDNFSHTFGIVEYDWIWNIGDRTALTSSGWFEPFEGGPRAWDFGIAMNRPDASAFFLGYRQIDPLNSKSVIASVIYPFSAKYALSANTVWDFGNDVQTYGFFLSRMGTDVVVNVGLNYNSTLNTFGFAFEMIPNLARRTGRSANLYPVAPIDNLAPVLNQR